MAESAENGINWHRLFSVALQDFFHNSPFEVESEVDLSKKQQLLDLVIIRKKPGKFLLPLPDGLEDLVEHNLITFKSYQETLDDWAIHELIGHYVNYRKQRSPSFDNLLPSEQFQLFAVTARFPSKLSKQVEFRTLHHGVFEFTWGTQVIRLIVANQLSIELANVIIQLFSADTERVGFAARNYQPVNFETSSIVDQLLVKYGQEGFHMPYTLKDFKNDVLRQIASEPESVRSILERIDVNQRLEGLDAKQRLEGLGAEQILEQLDPQLIEAFLERRRGKQTQQE
jgi:hypothetical protein